MRRAKTHFEQIPVAVVKKIAEEAFPEVKEVRNNNVVLKVPARKTEPRHGGTFALQNRDLTVQIRLGSDDDGVIKYPDWQRPVQEALVEVDKEKLKSRVGAAETAIFHRLQAISSSSDHSAERQAIADALALIRALKRDALDFPEWEKK
jgi:hypothetical protein